jgi:hypothetical protein
MTNLKAVSQMTVTDSGRPHFQPARSLGIMIAFLIWILCDRHIRWSVNP